MSQLIQRYFRAHGNHYKSKELKKYIEWGYQLMKNAVAILLPDYDTLSVKIVYNG